MVPSTFAHLMIEFLHSTALGPAHPADPCLRTGDVEFNDMPVEIGSRRRSPISSTS
jgi:hypothetical protein